MTSTKQNITRAIRYTEHPRHGTKPTGAQHNLTRACAVRALVVSYPWAARELLTGYHFSCPWVVSGQSMDNDTSGLRVSCLCAVRGRSSICPRATRRMPGRCRWAVHGLFSSCPWAPVPSRWPARGLSSARPRAVRGLPVGCAEDARRPSMGSPWAVFGISTGLLVGSPRAAHGLSSRCPWIGVTICSQSQKPSHWIIRASRRAALMSRSKKSWALAISRSTWRWTRRTWHYRPRRTHIHGTLA